MPEEFGADDRENDNQHDGHARIERPQGDDSRQERSR